MKQKIVIALTCILFVLSLQAQNVEISSQRKAIRTSGDIGAALLPIAGLTVILIENDWKGLKQGMLAGATALGTTYLLKEIVKKERPDHSNNHSFPSMHSAVSFTAASFIQKRYGWKWGIPAYTLSTYVAWSRVYGKKHDGWDVLTGAAIGIGSGFIFTRPFAKKHQLTICPVADTSHCGIYTSMRF